MSSKPKAKTLYDGTLCAKHLCVKLMELCAYIANAPSGADFLTLSRLVGHFGKTIIGVQSFNIRLALKRKMIATPSWRAHIYRQLGGALGLKRWEARASRPPVINSAPLGFTARSRTKDTALNSSLSRDRFHTDFEGQFCLAPLPRGPRPVAGRLFSKASSQLGYSSRAQKPIALFPYELRPKSVTHPEGHYHKAPYGDARISGSLEPICAPADSVRVKAPP